MNTERILEAIYSRINDDKATYGVSSVWSLVVPDFATVTLPAVIIELAESSGTQDAQDSSFVDFLVNFTIVCSRNQGAALTYTSPMAVRDAIYGDAVLQADRIPTYGFHRWTPAINDANTSSPGMIYQSGGSIRTEDPDNLVGYELLFLLRIQQLES